MEDSQLVMTGTGPGQGVAGFIADPTFFFDPVADPYPPGNPPIGFTPLNEPFAGIIHAEPPGGGAQHSLYCIDILTATYPGIGYKLGTWDATNVPNVGYVARLLNEYYPNNPSEPAGLTVNEQAAAVQAAIWFFTDKYVLNESDPLRPVVVGIVDHIKAEGPLIEAPPPSLTITPSSASVPAGHVSGPFTVTSSAGDASVTVTGGDMWSNAAATDPIANGATVPSGQQIWLTSTGPTVAVLEATAVATVPSGNVYLYDGGNSGVVDAQHLILAVTGTLTTTISSTAEFLAPGSLVVKKTITGPAGDHHEEIVIHTECDGIALTPDLVIPAGEPAGDYSHTYTPIAAGSKCIVTETSDGSSSSVEVIVTGDGQEVTIPPGGSASADITDTYNNAPGSLLVRKTIAGPGADHHGEIVIHSECNGTALTPDFVIPADTPAGDKTQQYDNIPTPATCTVTETVDGHTSTVSVVVEGSGQTVEVPPGDIVEAEVTDTYGLLPGELEVTKTIAGTEAGTQGAVTIHTECTNTDPTVTPDFVIPALSPPGVYSQLYSPVPAGAVCTSTETVDGHTSTVSVVVEGSPATTTMPPTAADDGAANAIVDVYGPADGSLLVTKGIAGTEAGHQGPITIHVVCNGTALTPDFVIAAGTPPGTVLHSFDNIPAGSVCTVTETSDGATSTVTVTVTGDNQQVTVPPGDVVVVGLIDVYESTPGSLHVSKTIAGPAAGQQGQIAILVSCGGVVYDFAFLIPAGTAAGTVSRFFNELPAGAACTVTETQNGRTDTVAGTGQGSGQTMDIPADGTASASLTDSFSTATAPVAPITPVSVSVTG